MNVLIYYAPDFSQEQLSLPNSKHYFSQVSGELSKLKSHHLVANAELIVLIGFSEKKNTLDKVSELLNHQANVSIALYANEPTSSFLIECMKIGVSDILTEYSAKAVTEIAEKNQTKFSQQQRSKVLKQQAISVLAAKGGDGATLIAANIAAYLAKENEKVLLVDLSLPFGDLDMYVTQQKATYDFVDITNAYDRLDGALLESMVQKVTANLHLIPAPFDFEKAMTITTEKISPLIDLLKKTYDYVVFDVGANLDPLILESLEKANFILLVLNRNLPSIRQANQKLNYLMSNIQLSSKIDLVLNGKDASAELSLRDLESALDKTIKQSAPYDAALIKESILKNVPAIQVNSKSDFYQCISSIVGDINGVETGKSGSSLLARIFKIGRK